MACVLFAWVYWGALPMLPSLVPVGIPHPSSSHHPIHPLVFPTPRLSVCLCMSGLPVCAPQEASKQAADAKAATAAAEAKAAAAEGKVVAAEAKAAADAGKAHAAALAAVEAKLQAAQKELSAASAVAVGACVCWGEGAGSAPSRMFPLRSLLSCGLALSTTTSARRAYPSSSHLSCLQHPTHTLSHFCPPRVHAKLLSTASLVCMQALICLAYSVSVSHTPCHPRTIPCGWRVGWHESQEQHSLNTALHLHSHPCLNGDCRVEFESFAACVCARRRT